MDLSDVQKSEIPGLKSGEVLGLSVGSDPSLLKLSEIAITYLAWAGVISPSVFPLTSGETLLCVREQTK